MAAELLERLQQRFTLHGTAVIGVQHQRLIDTALSQHSPAPHLSGVLGGFTHVNLPADDFSAIEIDDQVEIEKQPLDWSGQPRDIPGPHLVGGSCHQPWRFRSRPPRPAAAPVVVLVRLPHGRPPTIRQRSEEIKRLYASGVSKREIAKRLGISRTSVRRLLGLSAN
jgi:hypothetical protein